MLNLEPATDVLARLIGGVRDDQLDGQTPCEGMTVGDLLDHIDGLSVGFAKAAAKTNPPGEGKRTRGDAGRLGADWRTRIPGRLVELVVAWRDELAWTGMTRVGGVDMPGEVCGVVAIDEVVVHGWDLAVSTGQTFSHDPRLADAAYAWVQKVVAEHPTGSPGLFGPPVQVPDGAPLFDRLLGLTGRDPAWRP